MVNIYRQELLLTWGLDVDPTKSEPENPDVAITIYEAKWKVCDKKSQKREASVVSSYANAYAEASI